MSMLVNPMSPRLSPSGPPIPFDPGEPGQTIRSDLVVTVVDDGDFANSTDFFEVKEDMSAPSNPATLRPSLTNCDLSRRYDAIVKVPFFASSGVTVALEFSVDDFATALAFETSAPATNGHPNQMILLRKPLNPADVPGFADGATLSARLLVSISSADANDAEILSPDPDGSASIELRELTA